MDAMNEPPRMTAEEADARFAALVAQHREGRERRPATPGWRGLATRGKSTTPVLIAVYVVGVMAGQLIHGKPLLAFLIGVPIVLLGRASLKRNAGHGDVAA